MRNETIHLIEPAAPKRQHGVLARCGALVPSDVEQAQRGQRASCPDCLRLEREDEQSVRSLTQSDR